MSLTKFSLKRPVTTLLVVLALAVFGISSLLGLRLELMPDTETATTDQILPLVKCELGLAFLPEPMARESIKKHEIVQISLKEDIPERNICMVYDWQHPLNSAARQLKKIILESK